MRFRKTDGPVGMMLRLAAALVAVQLVPLLAHAQSPDKESRLKVATCQFPVSADVDENAKYIRGFIEEAADNGADLVHFSEAALTGYGKVDFPDFRNFDWDRLRARTAEIINLAKERGVWVVLGSAHYLCPEEKPTNCLYVISPDGEIVDRYDKSMCTGGDLQVYTPGDHLVTLDLKGIRCGLLICYDSCFPEMYNAYRHQGVQVMLHSFYNAHHKGKTILDEFIPAEIRVRASDNLMWVVANNSTGEHSAWPACIARPDGSLTTLERGVPGILYRTFPDKKTTDEFPSWTHNNKAMVLPPDEVYHNGTPSVHPRATNRQALP